MNPEELEKPQKDIAHSMVRRKTFEQAKVLKKWQVIVAPQSWMRDISKRTKAAKNIPSELLASFGRQLTETEDIEAKLQNSGNP